MIYVTAYLSTLVVFVFVDMAWLGTMASRLYRPTLGDIMLATVNLPAGIAFYLIYPVGLVYFAILPALKSGSIAQAMLGGALFGFFTYITYDLTNQATLRNWTTQLTLIDAGWGSLLGAIAATAGFWVTIKLLTQRSLAETTGISAVAVVDLLVHLLAGDGNLVAVGNHHVVANVDMWGVLRLILASERIGDHRG